MGFRALSPQSHQEGVGIVTHIEVALRCSVIVFADDRVLLVHRPEQQDWTLPGGTPRPGETLLACARRELREETGMFIDPGTCALIVEFLRPDTARLIDLVFLSPGHPAGYPGRTEGPLHPEFVPLSRLDTLTLHPPVAAHLIQLHSHTGPVVAKYLHHAPGDSSVTSR